MAATTIQPQNESMRSGIDPMIRVAAWMSLAHAALWGLLLFRWITFGSIGWNAFPFEDTLADSFSGIVPYLIYGIGLAIDIGVGVLLLLGWKLGEQVGIGRNILFIALAVGYWFLTGEFFGTIYVLGLAGLMRLLLTRQSAWAINYPAAFWLVVFFVLPNLLVFFISLSERGPGGTVIYPEFSIEGIGQLFNDYGRFFSRIGGDFIYLKIFRRSFGLALTNTVICLLFGYPFAYWIARSPEKWRNTLVFLVMIPFWTNFLVRTYAWMLLLRDSGLINTFWTSSLHDLAVSLAGNSGFFNWLAGVTADPLPLLFNQGAVFLGLFYGFFPFVVLPLYSNLEKLDWSLLEAAADLGANSYYSTTRILLPLSMPGIVAAGIIVFVPSLGAYVTPALLGGGKVSLLGNLLQQQFMTARDWPFGSAIGFMMTAIMLLSIVLYFRVGGEAGEGGR